MQRSWRTFLPLIILALLVGWFYTHPNRPLSTPANPAATTTQPTDATSAAPQLPAYLPPEVHRTLAMIASGGPFPHRQDGVVFGNHEHLLPEQPRGYYHEYTVETPGARDRGARRIITGGNPPSVYYYTDDHYRSFREFTVPR